MVLLDYPARLVFITGTEATDYVIRAASGFSPVSHAAIGLGPHGEWILHAIEDGVILEPRDPYLQRSRGRVVAEYVIRRDVRHQIAKGLALVGAPYDWREIGLRIAAVVVPVLNRRSIWPVRYDAWTCARLVLHVLQPEIPEWRDLPPWVLPQDLLVRAWGPSFAPTADLQGVIGSLAWAH